MSFNFYDLQKKNAAIFVECDVAQIALFPSAVELTIKLLRILNGVFR